MIERIYGWPIGIRYLGDSGENPPVVHDLENETGECKITELIQKGEAFVFTPDQFKEAEKLGCRPCPFCQTS